MSTLSMRPRNMIFTMGSSTTTVSFLLMWMWIQFFLSSEAFVSIARQQRQIPPPGVLHIVQYLPQDRNVAAPQHIVGSLYASDTNNEPDLLEYFDPLRSPHEYPNGIEAAKEDVGKINANSAQPIITPENVDKTTKREESENKNDDENDPFQWSQRFDVKAGLKTSTRPRNSNNRSFGISLPGDTTNYQKDTILEAKSASIPVRKLVDTTNTFDPTLSPHVYVNGTPDIVVGDVGSTFIDDKDNTSSTPKVMKTLGILLVDHGSKNEDSNKRLEDLAALYQQSDYLGSPITTNMSARNSETRVIVEACHMEIASPSIQEGMASLLEQGVDEIVCHPYFLSPGRHVTQDIPQLIQNSIETLSVQIPVRTTSPVGSQTDIMVRAIHSLVAETSQFYNHNSRIE